MESTSTYTLLEISHFRQIAFQKFPSLEHSWPAMRACSLIVHGLGESDLHVIHSFLEQHNMFFQAKHISARMLLSMSGARENN